MRYPSTVKKMILAFLATIPAWTSGRAQGKTLDIDPVFQRTPEWCWVSCGEMIFKYYDVCCINGADDFQCGIIALISPQCNSNCYSCPIPAGSTEVIVNMLRAYPTYAHNICGSEKLHVYCDDRYGAVSISDVKETIDNDRPLLAGISPAGGGTAYDAAHATLIVGYDSDDDNDWLIINDPFPYAAVGMQDPYTFYGGEELQAGQYKINYKTFRSSFAWNRTLGNIH